MCSPDDRLSLNSSSTVHVSADILHQKMTETCASAHIGGINIVLLEGVTPDIQYVLLYQTSVSCMLMLTGVFHFTFSYKCEKVIKLVSTFN